MAATREAMLVTLVALLAGLGMAAVPGPKDPRYPDYIVDPKVTCSSEGVFPHPRNCSWYYRCVDRMNIGYYHTYYFECEPGTVFADELDQCVFPFLANKPCGQGQQVTTVIVQSSTEFVLIPVNTVPLTPTTIISAVPSTIVITAPPTTVIAPTVSTVVAGQVTTVIPQTIVTTTVIVGAVTSTVLQPVRTIVLPPRTITSEVPFATVITGLPTTVIALPIVSTVVPGRVTTVYPYTKITETKTTVIIAGSTTFVHYPNQVGTAVLPPTTVTSLVPATIVTQGPPTTVIALPISVVVPGHVTTIVPYPQPITTVIVGVVTTVVTGTVNTIVPDPITITSQVPSTVVITAGPTTIIYTGTTDIIAGQVTTYVPLPQPITPTPTIPPISTTEPPTETPTPSPGIVALCKFRDEECTTYDICKPSKESQTLCTACFVGQAKIEATDLGCAVGLLYDKDKLICRAEPESDRLCETTTPASLLVDETFTFRCSEEKTRPDDPWIKKRFCDSFVLCDPSGKVTNIKSLCTNFYQCYKSADGGWTSELRNCVDDNLYSFEEDKCVPKPKEEELCFNIG